MYLAWESNEIGAHAEACTRTGTHTHAWHVGVKNAKGCGGREGDECNLVQIERAFWDCEGSDGNHKSLNEVFDCTLHKLTKVKSVEKVHIILNTKKKIYLH